jgi:hypothetical protein
VLFGFGDAGPAAVAIPVALGIMILLQSLITNYELSLVNLLPLVMHLAARCRGRRLPRHVAVPVRLRRRGPQRLAAPCDRRLGLIASDC